MTEAETVDKATKIELVKLMLDAHIQKGKLHGRKPTAEEARKILATKLILANEELEQAQLELAIHKLMIAQLRPDLVYQLADNIVYGIKQMQLENKQTQLEQEQQSKEQTN